MKKKPTPMGRWYAHVKATPPGMIPVLLDGRVPAWNVAPGPLKAVRAYFGKVAPRQKWPRWVAT